MSRRKLPLIARDSPSLELVSSSSSTSPPPPPLTLESILERLSTNAHSSNPSLGLKSAPITIVEPLRMNEGEDGGGVGRTGETVLAVLLPLLIVLSTLLFLILVFLICVLIMKKKRGIRLGDDSGPVDLSYGEGVFGEGGLEGVEARWLEGQEEEVRRGYQRAKDWQLHYPPSSIPTDITLSQFLTIQEKGVSAWCFEPDYESNPSLYVQSRTEITFLADGPGMPVEEGGGNSVMANLPLPKLNEVYYFECKMYEKPEGTDVAIGLATKPYPSFRLPGWNKYSVAYQSDGFKSHNYPFTASSHGRPLAEGDVLGVGYRPRTGTVFFTLNGRKHEDAFVGLQRFNLFPTIGASGPATIHVNLGQSGFVFIEANVKKWGLAPSIGTLAPPPAYGSERGSILLEAGFGGGGGSGASTPVPPERSAGAGGWGARTHGRGNSGGSFLSSSSLASTSSAGSASGSRSVGGAGVDVGAGGGERRETRTKTHRSRRPKPPSASTTPIHPSPLRLGEPSSSTNPSSTSRPSNTLSPRPPSSNPNPTPGPSRSHSSSTTPRRALTPPSDVSSPYISPVDRSSDDEPRGLLLPPTASPLLSDDEDEADIEPLSPSSSSTSSLSAAGGTDLDIETEYGSPMGPHNPPTPNLLDISLHSLREHGVSFFGGRSGRDDGEGNGNGREHRLSTITSSSSEGTDSTSETVRPRQHERNGSRASTTSTVGGGGGLGVARDVSPPGYSPLDSHVYASGVPTDLPASMISAAFEAAERGENNPTAEEHRRTENESRRGGPFAWFGGQSSN